MSFAEQFRAQGIEQRDIELDIAIAKYFNSGGTVDGARQRLNIAAERMSGMGHSMSASHGGHPPLAQTRQQVEGDDQGHDCIADGRGQHASLSPSFNRGGDGQGSLAQGRPTGNAIPAREPTQQQRNAAAAARNITAITIMDTLKIDGRSFGNWTVGEARRAGKLKTREGYILIEATRLVANANGNELLRHVVKPKELQKIIQKAAEIADEI